MLVWNEREKVWKKVISEAVKSLIRKSKSIEKHGKEVCGKRKHGETSVMVE